MLTREQILSADDLRREEVAVPEWGGSVFVRTITAAERDHFEATFRQDSSTNVRARVAVLTVCDEAGDLLFTDADAEALGSKSIAPLQRIFNVACRLNRLSKSDVEDLEGNSNATPSGDSPTA